MSVMAIEATLFACWMHMGEMRTSLGDIQRLSEYLGLALLLFVRGQVK